MTDRVVRGGTLVLPDGERRGDVVIAGGRISAILEPGEADTTGAEVLDAGGLLVMPGVVDAHVHFDEPGRTEWEGFDAGSAAAVAGGVTTVVDMPIDSHPPTTRPADVRAKAACAERSSRVDVALWGGLVPGSVARLPGLLAAGVVGFKAFACPSGWDEFPASDPATLATGLAVAAGAGVPVAVHCELAELGHAVASEVAAVRMVSALAAAAGARLHVVHTSSAEAVDEASRWPGVLVESCPHLLLLDDREVATAGPSALCAPPVRDAANREAMWDRVAQGLVHTVASDHSPCPPPLKEGPAPWAGVGGVETTLVTLLSCGRASSVDVSRLTTAAAAALRLPRKGSLSVGNDADLCLVDPGHVWTLVADQLHSRHRQSPFLGRRLRHRVLCTLVRGRTVFTLDDGPGPRGGGAMLLRS